MIHACSTWTTWWHERSWCRATTSFRWKRCRSGRRAAHDDCGKTFAPAGLRARPKRSSAFCITRTCCRFGRSGGAPYAPARPAAVSTLADCCARTWWCRRPSRSRKCWSSSAPATPTWPWWWMNSAPSWDADAEGCAGAPVGRIEDEHDEKDVRRDTYTARSNWTALRASAIWKPSLASRSRRMPASRRWPVFCSFAWAPSRAPATRWSMRAAATPCWRWTETASPACGWKSWRSPHRWACFSLQRPLAGLFLQLPSRPVATAHPRLWYH